MVKALFETNILIDYLNGIAAAKTELGRYVDKATSVITWMEILVGTTTDAVTVSFADYKARMKDGQEAIYYITADNAAAAKNSPQLEVFKKKGIEVLLMTDRVDEWALNYVNEFDGTPLQSVAKGAVDLGCRTKMKRKRLKKPPKPSNPCSPSSKKP
jgi:HSP90 family molecular chaperone